MARKALIRIRRGTEAEHDALTGDQRLKLAEQWWATDTNKLIIGTDTIGSPAKYVLDSHFVKSGTAYLGGSQSGNARGAGSLDIQPYRNGDTQVASGVSAICVGIGNTASGILNVAIGIGCATSGSSSLCIGIGVLNTVASVIEMGAWSGTTRIAATRFDGSGTVAMTIANSASAKTDGGATAGSEASGTLGRGMFAFRRNGNEILIDLNVGGTITTLSLGTAS